MVKYQDEVLTVRGDIVPGATISVYLAGTSTLATLYANTAGTVALANPVTADYLGAFSFYASAGLYDLTISGTGITTIQKTDIQLSPSTENLRYAAQFAGVDAGAKIAAAIAALPSTGGTVDARAFEGAQTISSLITISKPVTILFGYATYTCSPVQVFQINTKGVVFIGCGIADAFSTDGSGHNGTIFNCTNSGASFIVMGSDNGHAYDAGEYDGFQGQRFENFQITNTGAAAALNNGLGNYGAGSYGIRDWRGGGIKSKNLRVTHFNYGFWGIQSDLNHFSDHEFSYNKIGLYLGPRSDQNTIIHLSTLFNDTAAQLDSVKHARFIAGQFVGDGSTSDYAFIVGSNFSGGSRGNAFVDCWFEQYDPNARLAFFGMGAGDSVQSIDTHIVRPFIVSNSTYLTNFMSIDNADFIDIDEPAFYRSTAPFSGALFNFIGTSSSTNVQLTQFTFDSAYTVFQNSGAGTPKVTMQRKSPQARSLDYQAGASQTSTLEFWDRGAIKYALMKTAGNTFQMWDSTASLALFRGGNNSPGGINSQGANALEINKDANSGTGGTQFWSGGASPSQVGSVSSSGLGTFNGGVKAASTGTTVKQMRLFTAVAVDPGSIAATSRGSIAVSVGGAPGIATGDVIIPVQGINGINDDLVFEGVTATGADQVTFFFYNPTAGAIDDTSHNWDILWMDVT